VLLRRVAQTSKLDLVRIDFRDIPFEPEQKDLLAELIEGDRGVAPEDRFPITTIGTSSGAFLHAPGVSRDTVNEADLRTLAEYGIIRFVGHSPQQANPQYELTPVSRQYYAWMKEQSGEPVNEVESDLRRLLESDDFQKRHPDAYRRWTEAEAAMWESETSGSLTDVGHACREALQYLVADLVNKRQPPSVDQDPSHTVARLRAVMDSAGYSGARANLLEAQLAYAGTVSDIIVRQEHGALKEGERLSWEDARRCVFTLLGAMFELDRSLG